MNDPNFREAMLQQQDEMVAKSNSKNKKVKTAIATAVASRKPKGFYANASNDKLLNLYTQGTPSEKAGARKEGSKRGLTAKDVKRALAPPPPGEDEKAPPQNPKLTQIYETMRDIDVINNDEKQNIFL